MAKDLAILVADADIRAVIEGLLARPSVIPTRPVTYDLIVHPQRDPGVRLVNVPKPQEQGKVFPLRLIAVKTIWPGTEILQSGVTLLGLDLRPMTGTQKLDTGESAVLVDPQVSSPIFYAMGHVVPAHWHPAARRV